MKYTVICLLGLLLAACGDSDSDKSTYNTCRITDSGAIFASDRATDMKQCWNITPTADQTNALSQCSTLVADYMDQRYITSVSASYKVASSACP